MPFSKKKKQLPFPASFILSLEYLHFISWKALSISLLTLQTVTARFELSQSRFPTPRSIPLNGLSVLAESPVAYMAGERIEATTIMNPSCKPQVNNSSDPQNSFTLGPRTIFCTSFQSQPQKFRPVPPQKSRLSRRFQTVSALHGSQFFRRQFPESRKGDQ